MATKPSKRILDWASGGTATDPGGAKEAAGWVVSERPPAFWWNWILQSFGDWLSWSEDSIDEHAALVPRVVGQVTSGSSAAIDYCNVAVTSITWGGGGDHMLINFTSAPVGSQAVVTVTGGTGFLPAVYFGEMNTTSQLEIQVYNTGTSASYELETVTIDKINFVIHEVV